MAELTKTQVSEKVKKALDWIVADSTTKANNAKTQAINDAATKYRRLNDNIYMASNAARLHISGGTSWDQGACLVLNGKENSSGSFWLTAKSPTAESVLSATAAGSLTWQSKNIVRSVNGKSANASGDVSVPTRAVGDQWISVDGTIPAGGLPFLGQTVGRSAYSALFSWAQSQGRVKSESEWQSISASNNGNVPYYSSGDGSTTFRLPKISAYLKGASSVAEAGTHLNESLPDHYHVTGHHALNNAGRFTSSASNRTASMPSNSGHRFWNGNGGGNDYQAATSYAGNLITSLPLKEGSNPIRPDTQVVLVGVYAFGEVGVTGSTTTDALASNLAKVETRIDQKLDKSTAHLIQTWSNGTSWYRKYSDGWVEQGGFILTLPNNTARTISLNTPFATTNYTLTTGDMGVSDVYTNHSWVTFGSFTTTSFEISNKRAYGSGTFAMDVFWHACGY